MNVPNEGLNEGWTDGRGPEYWRIWHLASWDVSRARGFPAARVHVGTSGLGQSVHARCTYTHIRIQRNADCLLLLFLFLFLRGGGAVLRVLRESFCGLGLLVMTICGKPLPQKAFAEGTSVGGCAWLLFSTPITGSIDYRLYSRHAPVWVYCYVLKKNVFVRHSRVVSDRTGRETGLTDARASLFVRMRVQHIPPYARVDMNKSSYRLLPLLVGAPS